MTCALIFARLIRQRGGGLLHLTVNLDEHLNHTIDQFCELASSNNIPEHVTLVLTLKVWFDMKHWVAGA